MTEKTEPALWIVHMRRRHKRARSAQTEATLGASSNRSTAAATGRPAPRFGTVVVDRTAAGAISVVSLFVESRSRPCGTFSSQAPLCPSVPGRPNNSGGGRPDRRPSPSCCDRPFLAPARPVDTGRTSVPQRSRRDVADLATERIKHLTEPLERVGALPRGQSASISTDSSHKRSAFSGLRA
jgi:hypothetical protein